jgi:hypothetical protein
MLGYEKEYKELVEKFGLPEALAEDCLASRNAQEVETVMTFLHRYGYMIKVV